MEPVRTLSSKIETNQNSKNFFKSSGRSETSGMYQNQKFSDQNPLHNSKIFNWGTHGRNQAISFWEKEEFQCQDVAILMAVSKNSN